MHYEILVEDQSGKKALDILVPKIIGEEHSFKVIAYKGIGRIPQNLAGRPDASKRILLAQLPKLIEGYGNAFSNYPPDYKAVVILVCDLDDKILDDFLGELQLIFSASRAKPEMRFCIAIEEGEAWFLGDIEAIKSAYPQTRNSILNNYVNDSICGTWETLADAVYPGGSSTLSSLGWQKVGAEKSSWAGSISPHMNVHANDSPSFCFFRDELLQLAGKN
jgi:hypothetical protein